MVNKISGTSYDLLYTSNSEGMPTASQKGMKGGIGSLKLKTEGKKKALGDIVALLLR